MPPFLGGPFDIDTERERESSVLRCFSFLEIVSSSTNLFLDDSLVCFSVNYPNLSLGMFVSGKLYFTN